MAVAGAAGGAAGASARWKKLDATTMITPITTQESATLNTGQMWKSMKSTTLPETPVPCSTRSVRFPSAPPGSGPGRSPTGSDVTRHAPMTIATQTTALAAKNSQGWSGNRLNAPPEFVVYVRSTTCGMTVIGGRPARCCSTRSLLTRSAT